MYSLPYTIVFFVDKSHTILLNVLSMKVITCVSNSILIHTLATDPTNARFSRVLVTHRRDETSSLPGRNPNLPPKSPERTREKRDRYDRRRRNIFKLIEEAEYGQNLTYTQQNKTHERRGATEKEPSNQPQEETDEEGAIELYNSKRINHARPILHRRRRSYRGVAPEIDRIRRARRWS